jgi:hypothetical protein
VDAFGFAKGVEELVRRAQRARRALRVAFARARGAASRWERASEKAIVARRASPMRSSTSPNHRGGALDVGAIDSASASDHLSDDVRLPLRPW